MVFSNLDSPISIPYDHLLSLFYFLLFNRLYVTNELQVVVNALENFKTNLFVLLLVEI